MCMDGMSATFRLPCCPVNQPPCNHLPTTNKERFYNRILICTIFWWVDIWICWAPLVFSIFDRVIGALQLLWIFPVLWFSEDLLIAPWTKLFLVGPSCRDKVVEQKPFPEFAQEVWVDDFLKFDICMLLQSLSWFSKDFILNHPSNPHFFSWT